MLFNEFGKKENPAILLLHGMIGDWRGYRKLFEPLEEKYRVIVPGMTGMYDNSPDFTSFSDEARQMEDFINENYGGKLRGVYGVSQGVVVLSELLARNNVKIDIAVWDGGYVARQGRIAAFGTIRMFNIFLGKKSLLGSFAKKIFLKYAGMDEKDFAMLDACYKDVSQKSLKRNMYENYTYKANPSLKNTDTLVHLWCGSREPYCIKSHNIFKKYLKNYKEEIFEGLGHGHLLIYHNDEFIKRLDNIFKL